jgi:transposase
LKTKVLQALGVIQKTKNTFVLTNPTEILRALVALKDVRVVHYEGLGPYVELMIEQVAEVVSCPSCGSRAQEKDRPVVQYVDLPVYGVPMLGWKKRRMLCVKNSARH